MRPGAPGTWNRAVWWAVRGGCRHYGRTKDATPVRSGNFRIIFARPAMGYGRSTHTAAWLTHVAEIVVFAWRDGMVAGWAVRWRCGAMTQHLTLEAEPSSPLCPVCLLERPVRPGAWSVSNR